MLRKAHVARDARFHSLWVGLDYLQHGWHPTVLLTRVAAEAPGLELGLVGILPLYHPVELAEQLATLDVICGGRVTLAAAIGWRDCQFRAFEVPQEQRLSRFQEVRREAAMTAIRPSVEWLYRDRAALGHNRLLPEADRIDVPFEQVLAGRFILGSPAECVAEVARYRAVGLQELTMRCQWPGMAVEPALQAIQRFGRDVLPRCAV